MKIGELRISIFEYCVKLISKTHSKLMYSAKRESNCCIMIDPIHSVCIGSGLDPKVTDVHCVVRCIVQRYVNGM